MIIKSLYCKNFMKFRELCLREIPEKGLIGIIGENEAGKSTIGEAISFGLFGKCTREEDGVENILFWGADEGIVEVRVSFSTDLYTIIRKFSKEDHSLSIRNETDGRVLSPEEMELFYEEKLKLSFKEFRYSSYVAQKELAIIQNRVEDRIEVIGSMLGLDKLETSKETIRKVYESSKIDIESINLRIEEVKSDLSGVQNELVEKQDVLAEIDRLNAEKELQGRKIQEKETRLREMLQYEASFQECKILKEKEHILKDNLAALEKRMQEFSRDNLDLKAQLEEIRNREEMIKKLLVEQDQLAVEEQSLQEKDRQYQDYVQICSSIKSVESMIALKQKSVESLQESIRGLKEEIAEMEREKSDIDQEISQIEDMASELDKKRLVLDEDMKTSKALQSELEGSEQVKVRLEKISSINKLYETVSEEIEMLNARYFKESKDCRATLEKIQDILVELGQRIIKFNDRDIIEGKKNLLHNHNSKENLYGGLFALSLVGVISWVLYSKILIYSSFGIIPVLFLGAAIVSRKKGIVLEKEIESDLLLTSEKKDAIDAEYTRANEQKNDFERRLGDLEAKLKIIQGLKLGTAYEIENSLRLLRSGGDSQFEFSLTKIRDFLNENEIEDSIPEYLQKVNSEMDMVTKKKSELDVLAGKIERSKSEIRLLEEKCSSLESCSVSLKKLTEKIGRKEKELTKFEGMIQEDLSAISRFESEIRELKGKAADLHDEAVTDDARKEISKALKLKEGNIAELKSTVSVLNEKMNVGTVKTEELKKLTNERDVLAEKIAEIAEECSNIENRLRDIGFSLETLSVLRNEINENNLGVRAILEEIALKNGLLDKFSDAEMRKKSLNEKLASLEDQESILRDNILYFPEVIKMYDLTNENIIRKIKPQIERYFATYLPKLTNNRYKKVSLQEDFSIRIFSDEKNDYVPVKNLSGGTEDQILLMFRLAFSKALFPGMHVTDEGISFHQFLFLDEPISSFDQKRQNAFIELLRMMEKLYQQIFVISHITELENKMDYFIKAEVASNVLEVDRI